MSTPLISADNTWALMAITCGWAAFSIYAEQTWKWASKVSGAIVALIGALVLTNLGIILQLRLVRTISYGRCCSYGNSYAAVELRHS